MLKVKIIAHTPEPDKVVAQAGKLCYSAVGVDEITQKLTEEEIAVATAKGWTVTFV